MTKRFLRVMLYKYGENVTVSAGSGRAVNTKAFIQPLRRRHRLYINDKVISTAASGISAAPTTVIRSARVRSSAARTRIMSL